MFQCMTILVFRHVSTHNLLFSFSDMLKTWRWDTQRDNLWPFLPQERNFSSQEKNERRKTKRINSRWRDLSEAKILTGEVPGRPIHPPTYGLSDSLPLKQTYLSCGLHYREKRLLCGLHDDTSVYHVFYSKETFFYYKDYFKKCFMGFTERWNKCLS